MQAINKAIRFKSRENMIYKLMEGLGIESYDKPKKEEKSQGSICWDCASEII